MELTDEQKETFSPEEMKIYQIGEAKKFHELFGALSELPDIFNSQNHEIGKDTLDVIEKYDKILKEANQKVAHIPKRFRIKD